MSSFALFLKVFACSGRLRRILVYILSFSQKGAILNGFLALPRPQIGKVATYMRRLENELVIINEAPAILTISSSEILHNLGPAVVINR